MKNHRTIQVQFFIQEKGKIFLTTTLQCSVQFAHLSDKALACYFLTSIYGIQVRWIHVLQHKAEAFVTFKL